MQLKQLKAFNAVARLQSFSEAVSVTGLSQPTLSRLIKQLEVDLEVELIDRYNRPLQLTPAGDFFYKKTNTLLKDLDSTVALTQKIANPPDTLNIGFVPSVLYGLLPVILSTLKQRLPTLEVNLKDISSFKQLEALKSGVIDVGFGRFEHDDANIKQLLLRHERYVAAIPKSHILANSSEMKLSELVNDRIILYHQTHLPVPRNDAGNMISEPILHLFNKQSTLPHMTTAVSDIQVALGLVAAGEGITLVPECLKTVRPEQISYCSILHEDTTSPIFLSSLQQPTHPAFETLLEAIYSVYEKRGITYRRHI